MTQPVTSNISDKHKLLGLDHLRAIAIISVFLFHYQFFGHPAWENNVAGFGWTGVDLFFVLSGFLIAGQLFNTIARGEIISMSEFFIKRFFRILPPFLVILTLYFAFPYLREWGHLSPLWRYLTFTLNFGLDLKKYGTFSHDWSLCVEEQFYLVLPLILWLLTYLKAGKKAIYLIVILFIAGFALRLWGWYHFVEPILPTGNLGVTWNKYIYYPTYNRLDGLLTGVSIAGLFTFYPKTKEWVNKRSNITLLVGLAVLLAAYFVSTPQDTFYTCLFGFPLISIGYGIILAAMVCPSNILFNAKSWLTAQIATLSYSIYLSHKIVIHLTQNLLERAGIDKNSNLTMLICIIASVAGALVLRYVVEKPALRLRDAILKKRSIKELVVSKNHEPLDSLTKVK
ncbi:acyltransferase family protein [Mucilaginibacter sp. X4EP1]|uniref:acyltransferase family protein n=1 Tax=Mucilaginibacter sp. X4EP1 TaxID=2723092 RepID=UPI0021681974|nr:acyltransferase [Mucilaginibacter sp. X4EP1]MCS3815665.1 peptidoglycan/LPS O-acetylase OafA/YrhL [Mucilaginibacter sp. X4EP1]